MKNWTSEQWREFWSAGAIIIPALIVFYLLIYFFAWLQQSQELPTMVGIQ